LKRVRDPVWPSLASALSAFGAAGLAVFFHGDDIRWLVGAQLLLLSWLALALARGYEAGLWFPRTPISLSVSLFWLWLGVSLAWSRVPATSAINFWWVGTFALVFWCYTLSPARAQIASYVSRLVLVGALALCAWALLQVLVYAQPARASFINIHSFAALLMLVAVATAGHLVISCGRRRRALAAALGAGLFLLFFTIALTRGRGTSLALWLAVAAFIALHVRRVPTRHLVLVGGLLAAAYAAANILLLGGLGERLASLVDPTTAASPRLLIWRGAWDMVRDFPWWGIGLGTYYLAWPPYRDPADATLGFYVHNDYLQIWIETGLPGVLLLISILVAALFMVVQYLRRPQHDSGERTEVIALSCGLGAVAAHSFLDFNLYTLSISLLVGLALGRMHELVSRPTPHVTVSLRPAQYLRPSLYRFAILGVIAGPAMYLAALGVSDHYFARGLEHGMRSEFAEADRAIRRAQQLAPASNKSLAYADLLRYALKAVPQDSPEHRRVLYDEALWWLDQSLQANPYQALSHVVRARLYEDHADLAGADWRALAEQEYRRALALNPRLHTARMQWAALLLRLDDPVAARAVLEAGLGYWYTGTPSVIAYYEQAARLRRDAGNAEAAADLEQRVEAIRKALVDLRMRGASRDTALLNWLAQ